MKAVFLIALLLLPAAARAQASSPDAGPLADAGDQAAASPEPGQAPDAGAAAAEPETSSAAYGSVVRARRPASRDIAQDATEVDGQKLRDSARASTFEALSQESAGVYIPGRGAMHGVSNGATGAIHVRGLGGSPNSQVLVVEDGVPDYQGIFGHPIPDAYAPFLIDDVLLVKGGDSVLFGTNAMGGVVVIRSRWRDREGYELLNDAACGSYSTLRESVSLLGRFGAWDVEGGLATLSTEGHRMGAGGNELVGQTAARYRFDSGLKLGARAKVVHLEGGDPGTETHPYLDHTYDVWRENASAQLAWAHDRLRATLTPYLNVGHHSLHDGFHSTDYVGGAIAELGLRLHPTAELLVGIATERVDGEVDNLVVGERTEVQGLTDLALYNQITARPIERLSLVLGTRELYSTRYGPVFLYKGGASWDIGSGISVRTRVASNYRQPTLRELYLPYPTANPGLQPERSLNWDFGASYLSERFEASCSGYRTEADNLIKYFGSWPSAEVVNIDHIEVWGVEGRLGLKQLGPLSFFLTGDWQDVGRYTRQNPNAKLNATLEAGQAFRGHYLGGSLGAEWVHGLYMADYARQPIPDVFVVDLALRYRHSTSPQGPSLEPYLLLRNLLDQRYAYVAGYPMPGFNVLLGLRMGI